MKPSIEKKLQSLVERHEELGALLSDAETINQQNLFRDYSKEYSQLEPVVQTFMRYQTCSSNMAGAKELLKESDPELQQMAKQELSDSEEQMAKLEQELQVLLLPRDPHDDSNIYLEVRAGAGGDEAAIFAGDLSRMYTRYAEGQGWQVELISAHSSEQGGYKE